MKYSILLCLADFFCQRWEHVSVTQHSALTVCRKQEYEMRPTLNHTQPLLEMAVNNDKFLFI